jgi:phosphonate transport system permease protein
VSTPAPALPTKPFDWPKLVWWALTGALVVWAAVGLDAKWSRLLEAPGDLYTLAKLMFSDMDFSQFGELVGEMWESISIAWMGTLIAAVFAIPLSFLAAENLVPKPIAILVRQVFNILRAVPEIILALAFIPVFGLTPMAGVVAIGVGSIGTLGKLFYELIEGIDRGPIEAADAVGATALQRLRWGVIPQVLPELTSLVMYRFEVNIRASSVLGLIGAGGIGDALAQSLRFKDWGTAGLALIIVVVGTIMVDTVSGMIRRRIVAGPSETVRDTDD